MNTVLSVENLSTYFKTDKGIAKAVENVSFSLNKGEMLGLIGESGCGKTTVAQSILRLIEYPGKVVSGRVLLNGKDLIKASEKVLSSLRWKEISVIPQSAMNALNPIFTIGDQIMESILLHENVSKREALQRTKTLLELVGIDGERWKSYPHEFSGGMKQRVAIAMALACNPKLVISDESTTGLDVLTQAQVIALIKSLQKKMDLSVILISHDLPMVTAICDKIAIMYAGNIVEWASTEDLLKNARHPYSQALLNASPDLGNPEKEVVSIPGSVPNLVNFPDSCRFHTRCPHAFDKCRQETPEFREIKNGHYTACFLEEEGNHG
ncbi:MULTISPECIES: ABC transporter ATP-binding protein [Cytobacillus]|uniref:ABC transporter ATP-binding protein n=3 Tax=Cytobacillus TaxID=2675230 RepID=A0AA46PHF2_CYTFI|nr:MULTISPECIES: ABC transporter ATP-binding protein [Cytobacillus]AND43009.1 dipeptide/oligopeptide/nickel ABC transporter ATP-binding protein [Cytobacillus oceanisediminis 2691]EWG09274.1 oligopeptide/dipeptide ABC transporter ATPase [Cytobacillus firmus DS1]MCM3244613.1 ABC transporter ATP-binding protein [Cytobacillus oceanisediminis]USK47527.1 ABC transporter ATP-binding protein [Cytobacillus oceanisediminis]UYG98343.1 ABC transporter ATP-binding protein [Cytobacillus firmus]